MPAIIIFVVVALATMSSGGAVYAAQDALPGDSLYGIKTGVENIQVGLAIDDEAKADTYLGLAEKRLREIQKASETENGDAASMAAASLVGHLEMVERHISAAADKGKDVSEFAAKMATKLAWGQNELQDAQERLPEKAKDALALAANKSDEGMLQAAHYLRSGRSDRREYTPPSTPIGTPAPTTAVGTAVVVIPTVAVVTPPISGTWTLTFSQTISDVQGLADDPTMAGQSYKGLLAKLQAAEAAAMRGQGTAALGVLEAFRNQLEAMNRSGRLSDADYQALMARYESLVAVLSEAPDIKHGVKPEEDDLGNKRNEERNGNKKTPISPTATATALPTSTATVIPTPTNTAVATDQKTLGNDNKQGNSQGNSNAGENQGQNKDKDQGQGKDKDKDKKQ